MFNTLSVTTPASEKNLTTLAQLKLDLGLDDTQDTFFTRVIETCSNEISVYLRRGVDEDGDITLGRESITEVFYDACGPESLLLGRRPVGLVNSVQEGRTLISRLLGNSDGAVDIGVSDTTFTSVLGPVASGFADSLIGQTIVITGAGAAGADHTTTIDSVTDTTTVELTDAALTTVTGATYTIVNPGWPYIVKNQQGRLWKRTGGATARFYTDPITVSYTAGWLLPGETGRNLPQGIEDACIIFCRSKIDQLQEGDDFSGPLTGASVEGVGSFQFADPSSGMGGNRSGLPSEVRALLDRYFEPAFA